MLASLLFPYDDDAPKLIDGWILELERERCVTRYLVEGSQYLQICNWLKHQKIDHPSKSRIPQFDESSRNIARTAEGFGSDLGPRILDLRAVTSNEVTGKTGEPVSPRPGPCPVEDIIEIYHELLPRNPKVAKITKARRGNIRQRWIEDLPTLDRWRNFFSYVAQSPFLTGRTPANQDRPPFLADIDWLCKPANFTKIAERKYHRTLEAACA